MKGLLLASLYVMQRILLATSYHLLTPFLRGREPIGYVVGPQEIASCLTNLGRALDPSVTVTLFRHPFYRYSYDHDLSRLGPFKWLAAPVLLAYLAHTRATFVYVGGYGFLVPHRDGRRAEFRFLRRRDRIVVCYFTGSEIRSHKLLDEFASGRGIDVMTTYQKFTAPSLASPAGEIRRAQLAAAADDHANVIINAPVDQMSYLRSKTEPPLYFYPDELIRTHPDKWKDVRRPIVVHAPSAPLIKGTPLVRAAVKKLAEEGHEFEYLELIGVTHDQVLEAVNRAHIVLNQFYAFLPGVFGIEALAGNSVLLTSADERLEPSLFEGANQAWVVTPYWRIYDRLLDTLTRPREELQAQADRGTAWATKYCSMSFSAEYLKRCLDV